MRVTCWLNPAKSHGLMIPHVNDPQWWTNMFLGVLGMYDTYDTRLGQFLFAILANRADQC